MADAHYALLRFTLQVTGETSWDVPPGFEDGAGGGDAADQVGAGRQLNAIVDWTALSAVDAMVELDAAVAAGALTRSQAIVLLAGTATSSLRTLACRSGCVQARVGDQEWPGATSGGGSIGGMPGTRAHVW